MWQNQRDIKVTAFDCWEKAKLVQPPATPRGFKIPELIDVWIVFPKRCNARVGDDDQAGGGERCPQTSDHGQRHDGVADPIRAKHKNVLEGGQSSLALYSFHCTTPRITYNECNLNVTSGIGRCPSSAPRRILIVRLSSLGDIVHVWPAAAALRADDPAAEIAWLTRARYRELLTMNPCLDEILTLSERPAWDVGGWLRDVFTMISRIRRQRYDVLVDLHGVWLSHWIGWFSGARSKLGLDKRNDLGFRLFQYRRLPKGRKLHRVRLYLEPLEFLGIGPAEPAFPFQIPDTAQRRIDGFFQEHKITAADVVVALHPGTAVAIKRWPADRFQELADQLACRPGVKIILVSGAADPAVRPASAAAPGWVLERQLV